ncbi:MAG: RidA family protein [Dechloromonas sp.]|nr:RidA family protein [Dechloromonas sp.]
MSEIHRSCTTQRWSESVSWQGLLFLCEVASQLDGDIRLQATEVLAALAQRLNEAGSDQRRILNATIYLPDPADLAGFNAVWDDWVPAGCAPVRACIHAPLTDPRLRVEIQMMAALA